MAKLSIVIPTYKRSHTLLELVKRLRDQSFFNESEIIIVNQNNEYDLKELLSHYLDEKVKIIYQKEANVSAARNNGFKASTGNIIFFIDDDIYPTSNSFLEDYYLFMTKNIHIDVLSPYLVRGSEKNSNENILRQIGKDNLIDHASFFTISGGTFYLRESFEKSGGFDPILFHFARTAEDYELLIRMIKLKLKIYCYSKHALLVNEDIAGGCDLRTEDYWISREKCVKSWCLRVRIHQAGKINIFSLYTLSRSSFLNKDGLTNGITFFKKQTSIFLNALSLSKQYYNDNIGYYKNNTLLTHL